MYILKIRETVENFKEIGRFHNLKEVFKAISKTQNIEEVYIRYYEREEELTIQQETHN